MKTEDLDILGIKIPSNLPRPSRGRNLSTANKIRIAKYLCEILERDKHTLRDLLAFFGIKEYRTWHNWANQIPEITALYKEAKKKKEAQYFDNLKERARTGLETRVNGETRIMRTRKFKVPTKEERKKYPDLEIIMEEAEKEIYIQPDTSAIIFALTNKDSSNFSKSPKPEEQEEGEVSISPITWVE